MSTARQHSLSVTAQSISPTSPTPPTNRHTQPQTPYSFDPEVKRKPQRLRMGLIDWLRPVLTCTEDEVVAVAGMDAAVFLRLINYGLVLFAFCTVWCCLLLIPINATVGPWGHACLSFVSCCFGSSPSLPEQQTSADLTHSNTHTRTSLPRPIIL